MAQLSVRQLDVFVAVMTEGSVTAAARQLNVSQPAVSRMLERFEIEAGFKAFERRKGKLQPTPEAEIFFAEVRHVYQGLTYLDDVAKEIGGGRRGQLRIAVFPAFAEGWIGKRVARYVAGRKDVLTSILPMSSANIADAVSRQTVDLGISLRMTERPGIESEEICHSEMVCIMPSTHQLATCETITPEDLVGENFISLASSANERTQIDAVFESRGIDRTVTAVTPWASSACHLVANNMGISIMLYESAMEYQHLNFSVAKFEPKLTYKVFLLSSKSNPMPVISREFRNILMGERG
ncbi:LysR substrate-binding domain-containing protein [Pantoea endophytica]